MRSDVIYSAIFRVVISLMLIIDIGGNLFFVKDIYAISDFVYHIDGVWNFAGFLRQHIYLFLMLYLGVLFLNLRGIGTYFTAALVFLMIYLDHMLAHPGTFWGDSVLRYTLLYFVLADSYRYFALRRSLGKPGIFHQISLLSIKIHFCLVYMSNALYKWWSDDWTSGYAIGYFFNSSEVQDIFGIGGMFLQFPDFIRLMSWFVLIFQTTLPIFIWFKRTKWIWISIGILMHIIMAVTLQLYKFELIMILLFGFFVTDEEWRRIKTYFKIKLYGKR
ncbi:MAG: hypothetical protein Q4G27_03380 [Flavobacteriaceae bacterium]|nr:hypothetical protein [Flavobacteriaceae bacterium]